MKNIKFIDLFAGIGGFHLALHKVGLDCVHACEIDRFARITYEKNFERVSPELFKNNQFSSDIRCLDAKNLPVFDVLCAGFPCQPFSQAGYKKGFEDKNEDKGNMFFEILRLVKISFPKVLFLENVRHLINHDGGRTFSIIQEKLSELGYTVFWKMLKASDYGLPQHRPRVYIICFRSDLKIQNFEFPKPIPLNFTMHDVFKGECNKDVGFTLRVGGKSSGLNDRRNWDTYLVDGVIRKITSREGKMMMGFPDWFEFPVSETQALKQLGNSVAVNVVEHLALMIVEVLKLAELKNSSSKN